MTSFLKLLLLLALAGALSACGGGGGGSASVATPPLELDALTVTPADGSVGVARDVMVSATSPSQLRGDTSGDSLVLSRDGAPVAGAGHFDGGSTLSFTAAAPLALLGHYTARVKQGVADITGAVLPQDMSWSFTVRDGDWSASTASTTPFGGSAVTAEQPHEVVVDASGRATAVWQRQDTAGGESHVWAQRLVDGAWEVAVQLDTVAGVSATDPQVAVDDAGNVLVVWTQQQVGGQDYINSRYYDQTQAAWDTNTWSVSYDRDTTPAAHASVAMDAAGHALLAWENQDFLKARVAERSNPWVGKDVTQQLGKGAGPKAAMDASGNGRVVWLDTMTTDKTFIGYRRYVGGVWDSSNKRLAGADAATPFHAPRLHADRATGKMVVGWYQSLDDDNDGLTIWAMVGDLTDTLQGTAVAVAMLEKQGAITGRSAAISPDVQVGVDGVGNAMLVWRQRLVADNGRDVDARIQVAQRPAGGSWSDAQLLDLTEGVFTRSGARLAMGASGDAFVAWQSAERQPVNVQVKRYLAESGWQATATLVDYSQDQTDGGDRPDGTSYVMKKPPVSGSVVRIATGAGGDVALTLPAQTRSDGVPDYYLLARHFH